MTNQLYTGIDLHKAFFQACVVDGTGTRCWEARFPRTAIGVEAFRARCNPQMRVAVEATTPTWHFVDSIRDAVDRVVVVDPVRTRLKAGYAAKTDKLDARRLADALRRDSVSPIYYPPPAIRELRELCRSRHALVRTRTTVVQRLRAVLLRHGIVEARRLVTGRGLRAVPVAALPPRAADSVERLQRLIRVVNTELEPVERDVRQLAERDPVVQALMTVRGMGPVLGLTIRAEVGALERFPTPAHLASYAGLVPRVDASASRVYYGRVTRRGSPWLRWALVEAAMHAPRRTDACGRWVLRLALQKGALKARVAAARRLCEDIFHVWPAGD